MSQEQGALVAKITFDTKITLYRSFYLVIDPLHTCTSFFVATRLKAQTIQYIQQLKLTIFVLAD